MASPRHRDGSVDRATTRRPLLDLRDFALPFDFPAEGHRAPWPALLVFLIGSLATVLVWKTLDDYLASEEQREIEGVTRHLKDIGQEWMREELTELDQLTRFCFELSAETPGAWKAHVERALEHHPGVLLISSSEPLGPREPDDLIPSPADEPAPVFARTREVASWFQALDAGPESARLRAARRQAVETREPRLSGPLAFPPDPAVFEYDVPYVQGGETVGLLTMIVRPAEVFGPLMASRTQRYVIQLTADGQPLYSMPGIDLHPLDTESHGDTLSLPTGETWEMRVVPTVESREDRHRFFARVVLGTGLAMSALLAAVVQLGQLARERARTIASARTRAIEQREAELTQLNQVLEARIQEHTKSLQDAVQELETFNTSISHDLRSPLGAILNFAAVLDEDYRDRLDENGREYLKRVSHCAQLAVSMMDSLLAFSRVGRDAMNLEPLEMEALVRDSYPDLVLGSSTEAELRIGKLPGCKGDRAMMRVVVDHLLSNALKFSHGARPQVIEVSGYETEDECVYSIRDNGVGFDAKNAKKLFGVFERYHSSDVYEGHGVGLAISRRILQRHQGRIWAESTPGKGAIFYFSVPKERAAR